MINALKAPLRLVSALLLLFQVACNGSNLDDAGSPTIDAFTAAPAAINVGRPATLSWIVSGATTLMLQPGEIDVTGETSYTMPAAATTSYTLEASNADGTRRATAGVRVYDWTRTANVLDSFAAAANDPTITGYSFVLFDKNGTLYTRSGGNKSDSSVIALASACKAPSVAAILTLVDAGKLDLDAPVGQYLAADPQFNWPADKAAITMRMLLAHTSGLIGLAGDQPPCQGNQNGTTLRLCAQQIANTDLVTAPGSTFNYGGIDYQLAGYIATLLSGKSWQDFFSSRISAPIGMSSFSYGDVSNPIIAGGAVSNAADYALFVRMIQNNGVSNGVQILSPAMIAEIKKNQIAGLPVLFAPFPASRDGNYPGYGFGEFISAASLHPGSAGPEYSDPGLFGAVPWFDDSLGYGAVLLITKDTETGLSIWDALRPTIISQYNGD